MRNATLIHTEYGWELRLLEAGQLVKRVHPDNMTEGEKLTREWLNGQEASDV